MPKTLPSPVFTLKCENFIPNCLEFHLDDQILYVGTQSGELLTWNLESNRLTNVIKTGTVCIITLKLLTDQNRLVSHNKAGEIKFWRIDGFELVLYHTLSTNVIGFCRFALHKKNMLLCKDDDSRMNCYSIETYDKITVFDLLPSNALGNLMVIKSINNYILCGYEANIIVVWKEDLIVCQYNFPEVECLMAMDVDRNGAKGVCAGSSNVIKTFCIVEGILGLDKSIKIINPGVNVLQIRPDNKIVAAACWDFTVRLFSWKSMKLLAILDSHSTGVYHIMYSELSVKFRKTKYMLAVANKDNKITLWDIYNKKDKD